MFRVVIADDENSVVQSLLGSIPWAELGIGVVGTAADGWEALELAEKERADIAVIDIRMPGLNGLELCQKLRERNDRIQLIIASGYAEFDYAEKAIQYGVIGYCLKPLNYAQVTRFLRKALQNLKKEGHIAEQEDLMEILERRNEEEIRECLRGLGFGRQGGYYIAVSCGERKLEFKREEGVSLRLGRKQWGYILKRDWFSALGGAAPDYAEGIGYMEEAVRGSEIYEGFEECIVRAFQYFVDGDSRLCSGLDETGANRWLDSVWEKVQGNQWGSVGCLLEEIERNAGKDFTVRSALRLCNMILSNSCLRDEDNDSYVYSVEQLVNTYGSFQEMLRCLQQYLEASGAGDGEEGNLTNASFMKLMRYINENYKKEISLTGAAQMLHMNANYVSQLFKKESGSTFVRYVTQKRLEAAQELLTSTRKPLTDIALEVGFNDTFRFIKTFKKFTGMTPGQYRAGN